MKYMLKSGILYNENTSKPLAILKGNFVGPEKEIYSSDHTLVFYTNICPTEETGTPSGDVRSHQYIMQDTFGNAYAIGKPDYAENSNPDVFGWPISHMPRVNHANIYLSNRDYSLVMENSQNYTLSTIDGKLSAQIIYNGLMGGWRFHTYETFSPEDLCGIFAFCRYIEQENEFMIV